MAGGLFPPDPAGDTTPAYIRSPPLSPPEFTRGGLTPLFLVVPGLAEAGAVRLL